MQHTLTMVGSERQLRDGLSSPPAKQKWRRRWATAGLGARMRTANHSWPLVSAGHCKLRRRGKGRRRRENSQLSRRIKTGKLQLRIDEARHFTATAIQIFEDEHKTLAIGALVALTMGLRSSEALQRVVRDLDDGAKYLWIDQGKTANARRHLEVPEPLQPYLLRLAVGKQPDEFWFGLGVRSRRPFQHQRLYEMVHSICRRAGVPRVCTHSLRGLWATLAVGSGVASHAVAESLGHHSFAMTRKHYAQPAAITNAGTARVVAALEGLRPVDKPSAQELIRQLDPETLAQLAALLAVGKGKGEPAK